MAKFVIKYVAPVAPAAQPINNICRVFEPVNAAADNTAFAGTYYDTNVAGWGARENSVEDFIKASISHAGIMAALKQAIFAGVTGVAYETEDADVIAYINEIAPALADQGFEIAEDTAAV